MTTLLEAPLGQEPDDIEKKALPSSNDSFEGIGYAVLEMMASAVLMCAAIYIPETPDDYMKQYVSSICFFTVAMTLKDSQYFFPDRTPLVTFMLYCAGLYTNSSNQPRWNDVAARVLGQLAGWGLVMAVISSESMTGVLRQHADIPMPATNFTVGDMRVGHYPRNVQVFYEGLGTMIECVAVTFVTISLVAPYTDGQLSHGKGEARLVCKAEARPPKGGRLALAALSIAAIHYALERTLHATLNPLVHIMHCYIRDDFSDCGYTIMAQLAGALFAAGYVYNWKPSKRTLDALAAREK